MHSYLGRLLGIAPVSLTDPADIEANRHGQITERQRQQLNPWLRTGGGCLMAALSRLGLIVLALAPLYLLMGFGAPGWVIEAASGLAVVVGLGVLVVLAVQGVGLFRRWAALNEDLTSRRVAQGAGYLVYGRGQYVADVQGRRLKLAGRHDLAVGTHYLFYYLPASGQVLSAEARGAMAPAQAMDSLTNSLATANGFSVSALAVNREGRLSTEQAATFGPRLTTGGFSLLIGIAAAVLAYWPQAIFGSSSLLGPLESLLRESSLRLVFILIPTAIGLYYVVTALVDLALGQVLTVDGAGQKVREVSQRHTGTAAGSSRQTHYYYQIGDRRFEVQAGAWEALVEGVQYRAYYTRLTGTLVNIEPLASPALA